MWLLLKYLITEKESICMHLGISDDATAHMVLSARQMGLLVHHGISELAHYDHMYQAMGGTLRSISGRHLRS